MEARKVHIGYTLYLWGRLTTSSGHWSEWPALQGVGNQGPRSSSLLPSNFQLLGMIWLLILSFHFCPPSALGSQQMISLLFTPVCPHTLSLCVSSFQTMFNVYPHQPLRATPNTSHLVSTPPAPSPARRPLDISDCWSPWAWGINVGLIRLHSRSHRESSQLALGAHVKPKILHGV